LRKHPHAHAPPGPQATTLLHLSEWWRRVTAALAAEHCLLQQGPRAPGPDPKTLAHVLARLERAHGLFLADAMAFAVIAHASALAPEQLAEAYLSSWPYLPSPSCLLAAVLDSLTRQQRRAPA
jgi:hypothetical protein